nr:aldehyde dehydrogenase family protein [Halomicroarcula sp. SYNS111]
MQDFSALDLRASYDHVIAGEGVPPESGDTFTTLNPATEDGIAEIARGNEADVDHAVDVARDVQQGWRETLPRERGRILRQIADALRDHVEELAQLTTLENGKPISEARAEAETAIESVEYFAGIADKVHGKQIPRGQEYADFTYREPYGVTAHIVPWNFPLQLMAQSVAAAMATGNTVVVKPGEETSIGTLRFAEIANETDLPAGVFNVVTGYGGEVGAPLAGHRDVDNVTFTGSTETGRKVAKLAAENITPVNLEWAAKGRTSSSPTSTWTTRSTTPWPHSLPS